MAVDYVWSELNNRQRPKATYELNVYLVPEDPRAADPGALSRVVRWFEQERIVGSFYDVGLGWLAPGERSELLFADVRPGELGFEYLIPYVGTASQFVPNAHTGRFGARCSACGGTLDDSLHDYIQRGDEDASTAALLCACGRRTPLERVVCDIETAVTPAYLNFCHVNSGELRAESRSAIEDVLGCGVRLVRERL